MQDAACINGGRYDLHMAYLSPTNGKALIVGKILQGRVGKGLPLPKGPCQVRPERASGKLAVNEQDRGIAHHLMRCSAKVRRGRSGKEKTAVGCLHVSKKGGNLIQIEDLLRVIDQQEHRGLFRGALDEIAGQIGEQKTGLHPRLIRATPGIEGKVGGIGLVIGPGAIQTVASQCRESGIAQWRARQIGMAKGMEQANKWGVTLMFLNKTDESSHQIMRTVGSML
jgi:hypothetical protein